MGRIIFALIAFIAIWSPSVASAQDELNSRELRALSKSAADRQARHDLLSILRPMKSYPHGNMRRIGDIWFTTKPYATAIPGICARDLLSLYYAPVENSRAYEETPVRPYKLETSTSYTFVRPPSTTMLSHKDSDTVRLPWQPECDKASKDDFSGWFSTDDPELAVRGFLAFEAALVRFKAGTLSAKSCVLYPVNEQKGCVATLAELADFTQLNTVRKCSAETGQICFQIDVQMTNITIHAKAREDGIRPEDIISIDAEQYIIVT